ncbi:MAG: hypothetical protein KF816_07115 [Melioribacteraceae bacterium]|jgi:hypothetical protein|nr:hypothetical protein [Melioribacteraceae bacterium]
MFRLLVWGVVFYFIYKAIKVLMKAIIPNSNNNFYKNRNEKKTEAGINKKDIIEAEFEEIPQNDKDKN